MKNIKSKIEAIKEELSKPIPEPRTTRKEKKVATKKKGKGKGKNKKVTKTSKKVSKKAAKSKGDGNTVSLAELANDAGISGQKARQKLRAAGIEREEGSRWAWAKGSKALKAAQKALSGD